MLYNKDIVLKMISQYNMNKVKCQKAYNYYVGKTDAYEKYPLALNGRSNRKVQDNYIKTFIDEEVSFMTGLPITYNSVEGNAEEIDAIRFNINNELVDTQIAKEMLIFGEAYEFYYLNADKEFKIKVFNPLNSYCYRDVEGKAQLFLYFYKKDLDERTYIEVIDDNFIYHMDESLTEIAEPTKHIFGRCPVGVADLGGFENTLFAQLKTLQDAYEYTMSDYGNEIGDTRLAYLVISGATLSEEEAKVMKTNGIIQTPENSEISYLVKNIPSDFITNYRDIIQDDMYRVSQHINNQTQVQSNTSGAMLSTRMNCLRIKITTQNQSLKECIKSRLQNLFTYLNLSCSTKYDYKDVSIQPQLNIPRNDIEMAQIISQLNGKLSIQTGLEQLSFITNGKREFEKVLEEQKAMSNTMPDLDTMVGDEIDE